MSSIILSRYFKMKIKKNILIIVGPTAVGKTSLSIQLAERLENVELISADSRQVYKFMNIGTAKPTGKEIAKVKHHFIDIKFPDEYYSAGRYGKDARQKIYELFQQGKIPIVVGGSGLYIRALVDGFFDKQISDTEVKNRLKLEIKKNGTSNLYDRLKQVDLVTAEKIHPNDGHRIVRALEVYELTGQSLSEFQKQKPEKANFIPIFIGLNRDRKILYQIIEQRVDLMIENNLVDEVKMLIKMGYHSQLNSLQTVGYREVFDYLENRINFDEMVALIKQRSRNYAKRQLTWFRKDKRIKWFNLDDYIGRSDELLNQIIEQSNF